MILHIDEGLSLTFENIDSLPTERVFLFPYKIPFPDALPNHSKVIF